jgi:DNA-binding NarL/FixJ family response regulator
MRQLRVVLAEDHGLVRAGIRALLESIEGLEVVGEAGDGHEALRLIEQQRPALAIVDIGLPGLNGIEVTRRVARETPGTRVLVLSMHLDGEYVRQALRAGAAGYLVKSSSSVELELAVSAVARGETYLSPAISRFVVSEIRSADAPGTPLTARQREILQLVAEGRSSKEIAGLLGVAVKTVETHRSQLMSRLGIRDLPGLVRYAIRAGIVAPDPEIDTERPARR